MDCEELTAGMLALSTAYLSCGYRVSFSQKYDPGWSENCTGELSLTNELDTTLRNNDIIFIDSLIQFQYLTFNRALTKIIAKRVMFG